MLDVVRFGVVVAATLLGSGCGTIDVQRYYYDPEESNNNVILDDGWSVFVYGGMIYDIAWIIQDEVPEGPAAIFDVPFSLIADTLVLPLSIYQQFAWEPLHNRNGGNGSGGLSGFRAK